MLKKSRLFCVCSSVLIESFNRKLDFDKFDFSKEFQVICSYC